MRKILHVFTVVLEQEAIEDKENENYDNDYYDEINLEETVIEVLEQGFKRHDLKISLSKYPRTDLYKTSCIEITD